MEKTPKYQKSKFKHILKINYKNRSENKSVVSVSNNNIVTVERKNSKNSKISSNTVSTQQQNNQNSQNTGQNSKKSDSQIPNLANEKKKSMINSNQIVTPIVKNTLKNLTINTEKSSKTASVNEEKSGNDKNEKNEKKADSAVDNKSNKEDLSSNNASIKMNSNSTTPKNNTVSNNAILNIALGPTRNSYNKDLFSNNTNNTNNTNNNNNTNFKKEITTTIDSKTNKEVAKEVISKDTKDSSKNKKESLKGSFVNSTKDNKEKPSSIDLVKDIKEKEKEKPGTPDTKLIKDLKENKEVKELKDLNIKEINSNANNNSNNSKDINKEPTSTSSRGNNKLKTLKIDRKSEFLNTLVGSLAKGGKQALDDKSKKRKKLIKHCADDPEPEEVIEESEPEIEKDDFVYKFKSDKEFYSAFCKKFYNDFKISAIKTNQFTITSRKALSSDDSKILVENYFDSCNYEELKRLQGILNRKIDMNEEKMNVSAYYNK